MENRARYILCLMALLMLLPVLAIKAPFADLRAICGGCLAGFLLVWNFGCNVARRTKYREVVLLYQGADLRRDGCTSALCSPTYNFGYWTVGLCGGCFVGFNLSVLYNAYYSLPLELSFGVCVNCTVCVAAWIVVQAFENFVVLREIFLEAYLQTEPFWTQKTLLRSQVVTFAMAELIGLLATLYLAFFQVVYSGVYKLALGSSSTFLMVVGGFCGLQCLSCVARRYNRQSVPAKLEDSTIVT
jgi:hypothetical protein